jgi:rod shape-determining protein MreC
LLLQAFTASRKEADETPRLGVNERHVRWVLIVLVLAQLFLITAQLPNPEGSGNYLEGLTLRAVAPVGRLVAGVFKLFGSVSSEFLLRRALIDENLRLSDEVEALRRQTLRASELEKEIEILATALNYSRSDATLLRVADIVLFDRTTLLQTLVVRVRDGGVHVDQPIVAGQGLVGRIVVHSGGYAKAQLITDRLANVGAMIERTRRQGIVRGAGSNALELDFVPSQEEVLIGDRVVTAGIDGIFPRGLPIGTISHVRPGTGLFHQIDLTPAVDFGKLDHVYILESESIPMEEREQLLNAFP